MKTTTMLRSFVVVLFACAGFAASSQTLTVEGTAPNIYIPYTVVAKDNFYSIGRQFSQSPKAIASFNNLVMNNGLKIGQKIKIPVTAQNFDAAAGNNQPVLTHVAAQNETLPKIAVNYNVSVQQLRQWNNLTSDVVSAGAPVVVGYLKAEGSGAAGHTSIAPVTTVRHEAVTTSPVEQTRKEEPSAATTSGSASDTLLIVKSDPPPVKTVYTPATEEPANEKPAEPAASEPAAKPALVKTEPAQPQIKEVVVKQPVRSETPKTETSKVEQRKPIDISSGSIEGAFAAIFSTEANNKSLSTINGDAATFKSTSGWQDKKYYVLINDVAPGTVLKVSAGNKAVYAKVLGSMPEMKENTGLLLRLSNSAASYLGIVDSKFPVEVTYYK